MTASRLQTGVALAVGLFAFGALAFQAGVTVHRLGKPAASVFQPPAKTVFPDTDFGREAALGRRIFVDTATVAPQFVGNDLKCSNCHLDEGKLANSAPLWGAYPMFPQYRAKNGHVNTFAERLQGCFMFSMNGKAPPAGDPVLVALETYAAFLARGAPMGAKLPGQGYPKLAKPPMAPDYGRGQALYAARCAFCHAADGGGRKSGEAVVFPPLWGARSYNWGAGMSDAANAAGFIKANMPYSQGGALSDQEAWDVAMFLDSQPRPQDPRFVGSVGETRRRFHDDPLSQYGRTVNGVVLGGDGPPAKRPG